MHLGFNIGEGISSVDFFIHANTLKGQDIPLYPSVINALNLQHYEDRYYPNRYLEPNMLLNAEEYLK